MVLWNVFEPRKNNGAEIGVCARCRSHHFHLMKIGGTVYSQCGRCKRMTHNGDF